MLQESKGRGRSAETSTKAYKRHVAGTIGEIRGDMQVSPTEPAYLHLVSCEMQPPT